MFEPFLLIGVFFIWAC